jgi:formate hydrogenlyase subunit 6/NADH:ubiquinone oxidoreductase subunit I
MQGWFLHIRYGLQSVLLGMKLTWRHFKNARKQQQVKGISDPMYFQQVDGIVTIEYPHEQLPLPDHARYRLHLEAEDCIVCDQCARICPVDCIAIEGIKTTDDLGLTSDGTKKKLYLPVFDIDMAKCCFCGLCTTVCPTECLTMTKVYDFSEFDRDMMNYHYGNLNPVLAEEKRAQLALLEAERKAAKLAAVSTNI